MGVFQPTFIRTFKSTNDLSAKQYYAVALDTANQNQVVLANAQTLPTIGILLNAPKANDAARVMTIGITTFAFAGGTIAIGDQLTANSLGKIVTSTTAADLIIGIAMEAAVTGDRFEMMMSNKYYHA